MICSTVKSVSVLNLSKGVIIMRKLIIAIIVLFVLDYLKFDFAYGQYSSFILLNTYEIFHSLDGNDLVIDTANECDTILYRVRAQKVLDNKLYVVSDDGCAVIDKNKICRVFITNFKNKSAEGTEVDSSGEKTESKNIKYLSDYSEFSKSEKEILNKLKNSK